MKNKNLYIIIVVFFVILLIIVCLCRKKIIIHDNEERLEEEPNVWEKLEEFPKNDSKYAFISFRSDGCKDKNNCKIINDNQNKQIFNIDGLNISFECLEDEYSACDKSKILIDNITEYQMFDIFEYDYDGLMIYKTDNNYIVKEVGSQFGEGIMVIYNNEGDLLKELDEVITSFELDDNSNTLYNYSPVINDNKLYYVFRSDESYSNNGIDSEIEFGFVDLNDLKYKKLYTIPAITYVIP